MAIQTASGNYDGFKALAIAAGGVAGFWIMLILTVALIGIAISILWPIIKWAFGSFYRLLRIYVWMVLASGLAAFFGIWGPFTYLVLTPGLLASQTFVAFGDFILKL